MSAQGENVAMAAMAAGLVGLLIAGFAAFGAPVVAMIAPLPLILLCFGFVRQDLRHVHRHGWNAAGGSDGSDGEGDGRGGGPGKDEPAPPGPSGGGEQFDWDAFVSQFWEHVERQPVS